MPSRKKRTRPSQRAEKSGAITIHSIFNLPRMLSSTSSMQPTKFKLLLATIMILSRIRVSSTFTVGRGVVAGFRPNVQFGIRRRALFSTLSGSSAAAAMIGQPLSSSDLRWKCDPAQFDFETTKSLEDTNGGELLGQERAESAIKFGVNMHQEGYNLYVLGPSGSGKRTVIKEYLEKRSMDDPCASDWAYVHNFDDPDRPKALKLPCGQGQYLRTSLNQLIDDIKIAIPAALESKEHQARLENAEKEAFQEHQAKMAELSQKAEERDLMIIQTQTGPKLAGPLSKVNGDELPPEKIESIKANIDELQPAFEELMEEYPRLKKKALEAMKQLNREAAQNSIEYLFAPLKETYKDLPAVLAHLDAVKANVIERSEDIESKEGAEEFSMSNLLRRKRPVLFDLYKINLIVDNNETMAEGAPVVYEDYPLYQNLFGKVEYTSAFGAFTTDFSLIKEGSLHRANGGYLVVQARDVLMQPFSWEALKRSLRLRQIKIESIGDAYGVISTNTLRPEPIDLDVKVVLLGDRLLYYMLQAYDPDFDELFKVAADFNDAMDRSPEACQLFARMLSTIAKREDLRPMNRYAIAAMIEQAAREVGDQEKLSTHIRTFTDLASESNYWAEADGADVIGVEHVHKAIDRQINRLDRVRELIYDEIRRGTFLVDVKGSHVGQVNGLSVMTMGKLSFGRPSRITATARLGRGKVVDIEREVELGGATHSKGVMILSSFLSSRYALDRPLCLSATLVFEQSYGMVDGDSASMAELCALLSVLSNKPIRQGWAITGSVNQFGESQAVGGVTEKIEGFFDVCKAVGLTGDQGVLIPASNVKHLMLRPDVLEEVEKGKFKVHAYNNVDEAIELLTGTKAGERSEDGSYPEDTVDFLVDKRLREMAEALRSFSADDLDSDSGSMVTIDGE